MGLALAQRLTAQGMKVSVFERERQLGGLSTYQNYGSFWWDRFYHVILPSDGHLLRFIDDIGLGNLVRWQSTQTGLFVNRRCYSLSNTWELLRFPLISPWGKLRLALAVVRCAQITDWRRLERISVEKWLIGMCGRRTYEIFWRPLLLAKLGENYTRVSAVFIWTYIRRIFSARHAAAQREHLGHVTGGYRTVLMKLENLITKAGGRLTAGVRVKALRPASAGGIWIDTDEESCHFDKVICTAPVDILKQLVGDELVNVSQRDGRIEYLGVICLVLVTTKPLMPYYVLNIADTEVPFTGVIGMSTVVSPEETGGLYVTYFPKYLPSDDPLLRESDANLQKMFYQGVERIFPDIHQEDVVSAHLHRAGRVQPLQVLNYSRLVPEVTTQHDDFFVLNTSQFVNNTLNNNEVIRAVDEFVTRFSARLSEQDVRNHPLKDEYNDERSQ